MKHEESHLQRGIIKWWMMAHRGLGVHDERMLFAIPNGGKRGKIEASIMKAEGVRSGVCDLFLSIPRGAFHGFYLELKSDTGKVRPEQETFMAQAKAQGYAAAVTRDWNEATNLIEQYLRFGNIE